LVLFNLSSKIGADRDIEDLPQSKNFNAAFDGLAAAIKPLRESGKKIIIVVDNPTLPYPEDCFYRRTELEFLNQLYVKENQKCTLGLEKHRSLTVKYRELLELVRSTYPDDVRIFDTTKYLCDENLGTCTHKKEGRFMYGNSDHISDYASGLIGKDLNKLLLSY
jgi:SGNH domain (fused to AT3 domains)